MTRPKGTRTAISLVGPEPYPIILSSDGGGAKQIEQPCTWCGEKLLSYPWGSKIMVVCDNGKCPQFRQPVSGR